MSTRHPPRGTTTPPEMGQPLVEQRGAAGKQLATPAVTLQQQCSSLAGLRTAIESMTYYGNTQARILDIFRDQAGSIKRISNPKASTYADATCDRINANWAALRQKRIEKFTTALETDDYTCDRPAFCEKSRQTLKDYLPYERLFSEREQASDYPTIRPTSNNAVGFLNLPAELKNPLYREWLVHHKPFELSQLPMYQSDQSRSLRAQLSLLRLNRQISSEAAGIFYGENKFRASSGSGWHDLHDFLKAIGPSKVAYLQHLTVRVPWPDLNGYINKEPTWMNKCLELLYETGTLKQLDLILPFGFNVGNVRDLPLDQSRFQQPVQIKLIHLHDHTSSMPPHRSQIPLNKITHWTSRRKTPMKTTETHTDPKAYALHHGWKYEIADMYCMCCFKYPVERPKRAGSGWEPTSG